MIKIEDFDSEFGHISIIRSHEDGSLSYFQGDCLQSRMNEEGVSTCAYIHVIHSVIAQSKIKTILLIGCAGGTLATMLYHQGYNVTVVDINPHAIRIARQYFDMPDGIECVVQDGVDYLNDTSKNFDAIIIDVFESNVKIPDAFTKDDFFLLAKTRLKQSGLIVMNVIVLDDMDDSAELIALNMELADLPSVLFDWQGLAERNTIVVCGLIDHIQIKVFSMPKFIREKMKGLVRRIPKKWVVE